MPKKALKKADTTEGPDVESGLADAPLFDNASGEIAAVYVSRDEPLEEGFLGKLAPTATEREIFRKWGGGTFSVSARTESGKHIKGGHSTVQIGGDPVWQSSTFQKKWERQQGIAGGEGTGKPVHIAPSGPSVMDMIMLINAQQVAARQEARDAAALREREAELAHARELEIMRADALRREAEIRLRTEQLEKEAQEREARREREAREERERNREFLKVMTEIGTKKGDEETPMRALLLGMKLARGDGEGGDDDMLTKLVNTGVGILQASGKLPGAQGAPAAAPAPALPPGSPPAARATGEPRISLTGKTAQKAMEMVNNLRAQGVNPNLYVEQLFDQLAAQTKPGAAPLSPPAPPAPKAPTAEVPAAPAGSPPLASVPAEASTPDGARKVPAAAGRATG